MNESPIAIARRAGERLFRFPGGLRLRHHKQVSCREPIAPCPVPERLFVPLLQHAGPPATCVVAAGQAVVGGELIGRATGGGTAVHAPTSGWVEAIAELPMSHPSGEPGPTVVIRSDGEDRQQAAGPLPDGADAEPARLRERIAEAGIVGLGGAVFPTGRKVAFSAARGIHTLILNGAECEPYISCDEMLMRECAPEIVRGARLLQRATGAGRSLIAIEDQMGAVRSALTAAIRAEAAGDIEVVRIQTIYPEGGERQLVQVLTGLEVPYGGHPQDLGLLVQNVATAQAVAQAVEAGRPLVERVVTVTGSGVREPRNLRVRIGTPIADLVAACGGYSRDAARLVIGGPMMGYSIATDGEPVTKATNCVLVLEAGEIADPQPELPCIRCGECARVCPARLMPQELHLRLRSGQLDAAEEWGLRACIECGCCDFVCPSHIPLVDWFRYGKGALDQAREEQAFAHRSRLRFEAREARLERQQAERARRLAERRQALRDRGGRRRELEAAIARARGAADDDPEPDDEGR